MFLTRTTITLALAAALFIFGSMFWSSGVVAVAVMLYGVAGSVAVLAGSDDDSDE